MIHGYCCYYCTTQLFYLLVKSTGSVDSERDRRLGQLPQTQRSLSEVAASDVDDDEFPAVVEDGS